MQKTKINKEGWWDKEEFEEMLAKGILSLFERNHLTKVKGNKGDEISYKNVMLQRLVKSGEWQLLKSFGLYVPPEDRIALPDRVDILNDELPNMASLTSLHSTGEEGWDLIEGYLTSLYVKKIKYLPPEVKRTGPGIPYVLYHITSHQEGGYTSWKAWVTVDDKSGRIFHTDFFRTDLCPYKKVLEKQNSDLYHISVRDIFGNVMRIQEDVAWVAWTINYWNDRRYLWNVVAREDTAKIIFGVHEEQIKSLFYSRNLPLSETGRKRPILHWVSAHRRRLRLGYDVDIERHMRGISKFSMGGTEFEIVHPKKA